METSKCYGGMEGKENHMDKHDEHFEREGHTEGKHGIASFHKAKDLHEPASKTGNENNHSGKHDSKKAAGSGQRAGHGSVKSAESFSKVHESSDNNS